ncbi:MAG TPA: GyrI-like domain-containing protein [Spirochaetia bacterium]|nr:GyrI-like domain-containing protein [Spirochaetia bacterium]
MPPKSRSPAWRRRPVTERIFSAAYGYLYGQWLPRSGWQPDDAPCFESYLGEPGAGRRPRFTFDLYVPLRPM